jgi:undecaprenyl-diphosphatase
MFLYHAFILGIVEGFTEFLPISSTAHLILASKLLSLPETEFLKSFNIFIQVGAIAAVVFLYWQRLFVDMKVLKRVLVGFIPTAVIGLLMYKIVKHFFLGNDALVLWTLFAGGVFLVVFELFYREKDSAVSDLGKITYKQSLLIGVFQSVAIVPGVSRSAATIIGGLCLGIRRKTIVEFSFLLAVLTMLAATGLDLLKSAHSFTSGQFGLLAAGFVTSFVVAIASIKFLVFFVQRNNFISFGIYRILVALLFWFLR